ncbi:MAG TPA: membrane protein insertion efficiency factor YidD [Candidatus Paceibacterota bacterium]|nr:membrane protein insertion efficiency factor YidD [Candidatus Paceibacterota bacterium]
MTFLKKFKKVPNSIMIGLIVAYQKILSPSSGVFRFFPFYPKPTCIFYPTCSEYSLQCFKKYSFGMAFKKSINRIGRCHPGNEPAVDLP